MISDAFHAGNATIAPYDCGDTPFYYTCRQRLIEDIPDIYVALAAPVLAYWGLSLVFHYMDTRDWKWLEKHRIHESAEVKSKNLVTRSQVVIAVVFQHLVQTLLGLVVLDDETAFAPTHQASVNHIASVLAPAVRGLPLESRVHDLAYFVYWWALPSLQLFGAMVVIDTWQYFLHRWMHTNKWLYRHFHSWHHRLYVPYAFGALYNHPVEGLLLDTLGSFAAEIATFMTVRQQIVLYTVATFKTVDDHCGYRLPWDPLQMITANNADYHDIHHQTAGIKANFAQPFFIHWDTVLGTRMTRSELNAKRSRKTAKAE
ncbi:sphingosine hydroxylase [Cylindrobasidium torrendii FP15055 ss-10]|uniref:Sphingosine hydroxylase n=1 Tax=Cylindrobasidium torrendii FP15055 ss-10 TaxID=1314674 RepID=A0A0D7BRN9_9AGAR|nr:sphingosine hydroxylase [Cylindrobasidium torrendii FP15055 ss-10]